MLTYVRQDLREIFIPTSLPDPPEHVQPRKLTWRERIEVRHDSLVLRWRLRQVSDIASAAAQVMQEATQDYVASWKRAEPSREENPSDKPQAPLKEELGMAIP